MERIILYDITSTKQSVQTFKIHIRNITTMDKILDFIHKIVLWTFTLVVLVCVDLPLKVALWIFLILLGIVASILYPIIKYIGFPEWFETIYRYATKKNVLLSTYVHKLWQ